MTFSVPGRPLKKAAFWRFGRPCGPWSWLQLPGRAHGCDLPCYDREWLRISKTNPEHFNTSKILKSRTSNFQIFPSLQFTVHLIFSTFPRRPSQRYAAAACMAQLRTEPTAAQALELAKRAAELMKDGALPLENAVVEATGDLMGIF